MHLRDIAILTVTAVAICASIATAPPPIGEEGVAFADIEIPPEGATRNVVVSLTFTGEPSASVNIELNVNGVSDPVTMSVSGEGNELQSDTASDGSDMGVGDIGIDVAPCAAFTTCKQDTTFAVVISRDEAPPDAPERTASLEVTAIIGLSEGPLENTNNVQVSIVP